MEKLTYDQEEFLNEIIYFKNWSIDAYALPHPTIKRQLKMEIEFIRSVLKIGVYTKDDARTLNKYKDDWMGNTHPTADYRKVLDDKMK